MSAATDPDTEAARLAPPPPGTVVWSMLPWPELLADFGWLKGRWAPLDATARPIGGPSAATRDPPRVDRAGPRLPDVGGAVLTGHVAIAPVIAAPSKDARPAPAAAPRLRTDETPSNGIPLAQLHAFVIL